MSNDEIKRHIDERIDRDSIYQYIMSRDVRQGVHGREILMHRGMGKAEWKKFVTDMKHYKSNAKTSWSTSWQVAQTFGSKRRGYTVSAWIPEKFIHSVPGKDHKKYGDEAEYIVKAGSYEIQKAFESYFRKQVIGD
jgi:hypothetical protein